VSLYLILHTRPILFKELIFVLTFILSQHFNHFSILNSPIIASDHHAAIPFKPLLISSKRTHLSSMGALLDRLFGEVDERKHQQAPQVPSFPNSGIISDRFFLPFHLCSFSIILCSLILIRIHSTVAVSHAYGCAAFKPARCSPLTGGEECREHQDCERKSSLLSSANSEVSTFLPYPGPLITSSQTPFRPRCMAPRIVSIPPDS
jgi:hypothetical protein